MIPPHPLPQKETESRKKIIGAGEEKEAKKKKKAVNMYVNLMNVEYTK